MMPAAATVLVSFLVAVSGVSALYEQCGGTGLRPFVLPVVSSGWSGSTACTAGGCCTYSNAYYSQCLPCTSSSSAVTSSKTSTTSSATHSSSSVTTYSNPLTSSVSTSTKATTTTKGTTTTTATISGATPSGTQIRSDQDPTFHFYLQNDNGLAVLGPATSGGYFVFDSDGSLALSGTGLYLNLANTTTNYPQLTFGSTATFKGWGLEGDTIITTTSSTYGRQLNFLNCATADSTIYSVYLELTSDVPPGLTCSQYISLHLPCLC